MSVPQIDATDPTQRGGGILFCGTAVCCWHFRHMGLLVTREPPGVHPLLNLVVIINLSREDRIAEEMPDLNPAPSCRAVWRCQHNAQIYL